MKRRIASIYMRELGTLLSSLLERPQYSVQIKKFTSTHKEFIEELIDDTWLCDEPIPIEETKAVWYFHQLRNPELPKVDNFEKTYGITFKELTEWYNKRIRKD